MSIRPGVFMMSSSDVRRVIEVQAEALGPVLHAGVSAALAAAHGRRSGLDHSKYPHLYPFLMRAELREFLEANPLPSGWSIEGDPRLLGQLLLCNRDLNLSTRFLKERRTTSSSGVSAAGGSQARHGYSADAPLPFDVASLVAAHRAEPVQLLLLWDFLSPERLDRFTLRIVHPLSPGVYSRAVPCDLVLDVQDGGEIFKRLEFTGSPDHHQFFGVEIDEDKDESGS